MCVTVRTLCLLVSSVSVTLSVARAGAVPQNGHDVGASSRYGSGAVIQFALVSERGP